MHLILNLPPETEAKLLQAATELGKAPEAFALEALDEKLADEVSSEATISRQEWLRQFDEWLSSVKSRNPHVDDSRESIYPDRW